MSDDLGQWFGSTEFNRLGLHFGFMVSVSAASRWELCLYTFKFYVNNSELSVIYVLLNLREYLYCSISGFVLLCLYLLAFHIVHKVGALLCVSEIKNVAITGEYESLPGIQMLYMSYLQ